MLRALPLDSETFLFASNSAMILEFKNHVPSQLLEIFPQLFNKKTSCEQGSATKLYSKLAFSPHTSLSTPQFHSVNSTVCIYFFSLLCFIQQVLERMFLSFLFFFSFFSFVLSIRVHTILFQCGGFLLGLSVSFILLFLKIYLFQRQI